MLKFISTCLAMAVLVIAHPGYADNKSAKETYTDYLWKIQTMESVEELRPYLTKEKYANVEEITATKGMDNDKLLLILRLTSVYPNQITFMKEKETDDPNKRFIILRADRQNGKSHGVIAMNKVEGQWKLTAEEWRPADKKTPSIEKSSNGKKI